MCVWRCHVLPLLWGYHWDSLVSPNRPDTCFPGWLKIVRNMWTKLSLVYIWIVWVCVLLCPAMACILSCYHPPPPTNTCSLVLNFSSVICAAEIKDIQSSSVLALPAFFFARCPLCTPHVLFTSCEMTVALKTTELFSIYISRFILHNIIAPPHDISTHYSL